MPIFDKHILSYLPICQEINPKFYQDYQDYQDYLMGKSLSGFHPLYIDTRFTIYINNSLLIHPGDNVDKVDILGGKPLSVLKNRIIKKPRIFIKFIK
jgi:hypothetical protein